MCGGFQVVKQLSLCEYKSAQAQTHERDLSAVCGLQGLNESHGCSWQVIGPTWDDDHIGLFQCFPVVSGLDRETHRAADVRAIHRAKVQVKR